MSISKGNGVELEFGVTALPDEITIDSLSIKQPEAYEGRLAYEGPEFRYDLLAWTLDLILLKSVTDLFTCVVI